MSAAFQFSVAAGATADPRNLLHDALAAWQRSPPPDYDGASISALRPRARPCPRAITERAVLAAAMEGAEITLKRMSSSAAMKPVYVDLVSARRLP